MPKVTRDSKAVNRCLLTVRDLPLERYKLPGDGRKWRMVARERAALLLHLATFANGDGTFTRVNEQAAETNYSPSEKRLVKHYAKASYYRHANQLRELGLLSWTRPDHHHKRIYTIHANAPYPNDSEHVSHSPEHVSRSEAQNSEHVSHSHGNGQNRSHHGTQNTSHSCDHVPSLDSPSTTLNIPSKPYPGAAQTAALALADHFFFSNRFTTPPTPPPPTPRPRLINDDCISILLTEMKCFGISQPAVQKIMLDTFGFSDPRLLTEKDFSQLLHIVRTAKSA